MAGKNIHTLHYVVELSSYDREDLPDDPKELETDLIEAAVNASCVKGNVTAYAELVDETCVSKKGKK